MVWSCAFLLCSLFLNSFPSVIIATTASMAIETANDESDIATNQSTSSKSSAIAAADAWHKRVFGLYVVWLAASAIGATFLTWLLWRAGNAYQDAVTIDANVRIEESRRSARAAEEGAAEANLRAAEANAKAEKERLERLKIEERLSWRRLSPDAAQRVVSKLSPFAGFKIDLIVLSGGSEPARLSMQLASILKQAGWKAHVSKLTSGGAMAVGLVPQVNPGTKEEALVAVNALVGALRSERIDIGKPEEGRMPGGAYSPGPSHAPVRIFVGDKG